MRKIKILVLTVSCLLSCQAVKGQVAKPDLLASVDPFLFGIEGGFVGAGLYGEYGLNNSISIRGELGIDALVFRKDNRRTTFIAPIVALEPRWYYNISKRANRGKNVNNNSANYFAIRTELHAIDRVNREAFAIGMPQIAPLWGFKRSIYNHFTADLSFGYGFRFGQNTMLARPNLNIRLGYVI